MNARRTLLAALAALAAGCTARGTAPRTGREPAVRLPPLAARRERREVRPRCHQGLDEAGKLDPAVRHVRLDPKSKACADCHGDEIAKVTVPDRRREFRLTFSHADHLFQVDGKCVTCHRQQPEKGDEKPTAPPMSACTGCHNHQQDFAPGEVRALPRRPARLPAQAGVGVRPRRRLQAEPRRARADQRRRLRVLPRPDLLRGLPLPRHHAGRPGDPLARGGAAELHPPRRLRLAPHDRGRHQPLQLRALPRRRLLRELPRAAERRQPQARRSRPSDDPHPAGWSARSEHGRAARRNVVVCASCHEVERRPGLRHLPPLRLGPEPPPARLQARRQERSGLPPLPRVGRWAAATFTLGSSPLPH